jgi:hypothetical protein
MHETTLIPVTPAVTDATIGGQTGPDPGFTNRPPAQSAWIAGWAGWGPIGVLAALLIVLYHGIAVKLVSDWYELPDFSHGFLIPFFAAFVVWENRRAFRATPVTPDWTGLILVILGLFELLLGRLGADLFLQRTSFVLLVAGLIWTLAGKHMLGRAKFVLFVLLLAIPLPTILFNQITFPLQLLASRFASDLLPIAGVPVLQEGNIIQLPAMPLEVAEACSYPHRCDCECR